jgi:hypothetical protein
VVLFIFQRGNKNMSRPVGIMASFAKVAFKKDDVEVFATSVIAGPGCFGPSKDMNDLGVINAGYEALQKAITEGKAPAAASDFNRVVVRGREYAVAKGPAGIDPRSLKLLKA